MRRRTRDRHLPPCIYKKHGAYWLVKKGRWERLGTDLEKVTAYATTSDKQFGYTAVMVRRVEEDEVEGGE